jgi:hypothetical protein
VGRCDPRNVVVSTPVATDGALSTTLLVDSEHPVFFTEPGEFVPGLLLVEAIRQTSLLAAARTCGFSALRTQITSAGVQFRADAALGPPLTCTARADPVEVAGAAAPAARVHATIEQLAGIVAEAEVTLIRSG